MIGAEMIVHCPRCGDALSIQPKVNQMVMQFKGIVIHFESMTAPHACGTE